MKTDTLADYRAALWPLPVRRETAAGQMRRVGVELEFSGLSIERIAEITQDVLGGDIDVVTDYEIFVRNSELGDIGIELDFTYLKKLGREKDPNIQVDDLDELAESLLALLARQVVPFEIVSPPLPMDQVWKMESLLNRLRRAGAKGTNHALAYAFGLHLNPELPDLQATTILNYLRAFLGLFDWIRERGKIDLSRRVTPYIDPFDKRYVKKVMAEDYAPDMNQLIDDYLQHNPTRNRALDLLPLFRHIDEQRVMAVVDDARINPRPTFHYRLPNCQIDEIDWGLIRVWRDWLQVEAIACDPRRLEAMCRSYRKHLSNPANSLFGDWAEACARWVIPELL